MAEISYQRRKVLICLCLAVAIAVVYWPVRHFEFTNYDDGDYVYENAQVQSGLTPQGFAWAFTTKHASNWHPVTWLSHMLDCQLFGLTPGPHHLVNVLIHIANTLLLLHVLNRMTGAPWRSGFVAALFGLHPLHVQSVAWIAERKDVLSAFFWMLTLWAYVRYVHAQHAPRSRVCRFYCLSLLFFALGLMSKPMVVTLPFVLLLLDYWPLGRTQWSTPAIGARSLGDLLKEKVPFLALAGGSCVVTFWAQHSTGTVPSLGELPVGLRIANALLAYVGYIGKALWPAGLAVFYPLDTNPSLAATAIAGVSLVGVTAVVIRRARTSPHLITGWFWYLGVLAPVIGLVQAGSQSMADRYTYLPLIGLSMMAVWSVPSGTGEWRLPRVVMATGVAALLVLYAVLSRVQLSYWENSEVLFRHALAVTKNNWVAHTNLGRVLAADGRDEEAVAQYEQAMRLEPSAAEIYYNLALVLIRANRLEEAIEHLQQAVWLKSDFADAHNNLAVALVSFGKTQEAADHWEQALRFKPDDADVHCNLGNVLLASGNLQVAIKHYEQACQLTGNRVAPFLNSLARAYAAAGRFNDAVATAQRAVEVARSAGQTQLVAEIETRLKLYRDGNVLSQP